MMFFLFEIRSYIVHSKSVATRMSNVSRKFTLKLTESEWMPLEA